MFYNKKLNLLKLAFDLCYYALTNPWQNTLPKSLSWIRGIFVVIILDAKSTNCNRWAAVKCEASFSSLFTLWAESNYLFSCKIYWFCTKQCKHRINLCSFSSLAALFWCCKWYLPNNDGAKTIKNQQTLFFKDQSVYPSLPHHHRLPLICPHRLLIIMFAVCKRCTSYYTNTS